MLSLAKLEGLNELLATCEFDLVPTLQRLIQERRPSIDAQGIEIITPAQASFICSGDKVLISQAVANLLDNAINFCDNKGQIKIELISIKDLDNTEFQFSIFNQGDSIPAYALDKIFDRFFSLPRANNSKSSSKSTGLGLSFVKEIMKLHHGHVTLMNSKYGVTAKLTWPG
jgi:two-component system sensor histidine kinase CreC